MDFELWVVTDVERYNWSAHEFCHEFTENLLGVVVVFNSVYYIVNRSDKIEGSSNTKTSIGRKIKEIKILKR